MTSLKNRLHSTDELTRDLEYFDSPQAFFSNFPKAWSNVVSQVLKLETKQTYNESSNRSYDLWTSGHRKESLEILPRIRQVDVPLYHKLNNKGVDFLRCRPVVFPLSDYLEWELHCYHFNSDHGEKIFFSDASENNALWDIAKHDFMVFDSNFAVIHNYDDTGLIQGGWATNDQVIIDELICIFSLVRARSIGYKQFLLEAGIAVQ